MTLEDLIKKLEDEGNGVFGVLQAWLDDYKKLCEQVKTAKTQEQFNPGEFRKLLERRSKAYKTLSGFIWGLYAAGYIADKERNELAEDILLQMEGVKNDIPQEEI